MAASWTVGMAGAIAANATLRLPMIAVMVAMIAEIMRMVVLSLCAGMTQLRRR